MERARGGDRMVGTTSQGRGDMEQPVNGSGGELHRESAIVDTKNQWTCEECGTLNTTVTVENDITTKINNCQECGAVRQDEDDLLVDGTPVDAVDFDPLSLTPEQISAGL